MMRVLFLLLLPGLFTVMHAQQALTPAMKAMWRFPASAVLSPVSSRVAFTIREADTAANRWVTHIHVLDEAGDTRQLTQGEASCTAPAWSPDGRLISFLSTRDAKATPAWRSLFVIPADGGEAVRIAAPDGDVLEYVWSHDGESIALLTDGTLPADKAEEVRIRKLKKLDLTVSSDATPLRELWLHSVRTSETRRVTALDAGASQLSWFPDGMRLVYQSNGTGEYNDEQKHDLWMVDLQGERTQLTDMEGPETAARISHDGSRIAFITQTVPDIEFAKTEISLLDMRSRNTRRLTTDVVYSVKDLQWLPDGSLLALFNVATSAELHIVETGSGATRRVTDPAHVVSSFHTTADGRTVFLAEGPRMLREVFLHTADGSARQTQFSRQLSGITHGEQKVITVRSDDGQFDIEAVLVTPEAGHGKPWPLLLAYHGGPYGDFDNKLFQFYPAHILAAHGIATVLPNVRGSSGYSDAFGQANRYDLGGGDYRDAMAVVDHLVRTGMADSSRMAVMGGSYGAYMTNWTITQTQRFKAAVSMYGIFSWMTDWSNSWQPIFELMYFGYHYWEKPLDLDNLWINRAPQTWVSNITTPTLILQGDKDVYTNIANSREMYQALHALGREVEFVIYHGAGHGLRNNPNQWIDSMERTVTWIRERIK
jgi:dipeptidyl aminopeptidase/acylaminoacyl peptidase